MSVKTLKSYPRTGGKLTPSTRIDETHEETTLYPSPKGRRFANGVNGVCLLTRKGYTKRNLCRIPLLLGVGVSIEVILTKNVRIQESGLRTQNSGEFVLNSES